MSEDNQSYSLDGHVSLYRHLRDRQKVADLPLSDMLTAIATGKLLEVDHCPDIQKIRDAGDKAAATALKATLLPCFTTSGTFDGGKKDENILQHSGLLQIDFDEVTDLQQLRGQMEADPFTLAAYTSPSGTGLKLIVKVPADVAAHKQSFLQAESYYLATYGQQIDKSCKNVARLNFLSYDPTLFFNAESQILCAENLQKGNKNATKNEEKIEEKTSENPQKNAVKPMRMGFQQKNTLGDIEIIVGKLERGGIDITEPYEVWMKIGFALASECGETGRALFHRISQISPKYSHQATEAKYTSCMATGNGSVHISTLFAIAKDYGVYAIEPAPSPLPVSVPLPPSVTQAKPDRPESRFAQVERYLSHVYDFRYNEVSNEIEYKRKDDEAYKPCNERNIYRELQLEGIAFSQNNLNALLGSDFVIAYDPFGKYFESLQEYDPATEPDYITQLCTYVRAKKQDSFNKQFKKMMVRTVACALDQTVFNKQAFILVHEKQNSGKSTFCRWLCPPELKAYVAENIGTDKDSMIALAENFLINLDELATLSKMEINSLKSFFSKDVVKVRRPFEKKAATVPRRASFVGSTNNREFLNDHTGSVRWLCFEIDSINWDYRKDVDINKAWKQAYRLYKSGFKYQLDEKEIAENEEANKEFQALSAEVELVQRYCRPGTVFYTTTDVWIYLSNVSGAGSRLTLNKVGSALMSAGFAKVKAGNNAIQQRYGYHLAEL